MYSCVEIPVYMPANIRTFALPPMKTSKILFLILVLTVSFSDIKSQETIIPLNNNPALMNKAKSKKMMRMMSAVDDTIPIPFRDDFSRPGVYPDETLWLDSGVFINNNYPDFPVTIGVATFDGLNYMGCPYQPASTQDSVADVLTSHCIDLALASTDTSVWFSFFYQPQGMGDAPESGDSLVLQFKDSGGTWKNVWAVDGREDSAFQRVNIRVTGAEYLFKGFQFRFYNIATVNGNRDHWHLDYVWLDKNRFENDGLEDFSLIKPIGSLLTEFTAMPYSHYKALGTPPVAGTLVPDMSDSVYVLNYGPASFTQFIDIIQVGQPVPDYHVSTGIFNGNPLSYVNNTLPLNYYFPALPGDSVDYLVKSFLDDPVARLNKYNDTSYYYQHFYNYYSYDDGSAEVGYGITGNVDVSMAYLFNVKVADTLRGVQIYFNPTGLDVTNKLFQLTVWSDINLTTNQSIEMYRMINQKPGECDSLNGFKTYLFDTTLVVGPGNIWVGMIQNEPQALYGVGLDRNTDSRTKMYYHIDGIWSGSSIFGSWMIRPLFGKKIPVVSVEENENLVSDFSVFPNPANDHAHIRFNNRGDRNYTCQIFDCIGSLLREELLSPDGNIDISALSKGIYIVRIYAPGDRTGKVQKLIIQ